MTDAVPEMRLELVPIPVSNVDQAKAFYQQAGFALNVDVEPRPGMRVVQFTPPGSSCSIVFGTGMGELTNMKPGSIKGIHLVVANINDARDALAQRSITVGAVSDVGGVKYVEFRDPDGNLWLLQEFPPEMRSPGQSFYEAKRK